MVITMKNFKKLSILIQEANPDLQLEQINIASNLINDLGYDSLQLMQLVALIEEKFDMMFSENDFNVDTLSSIEGLLNVINKESRNE